MALLVLLNNFMHDFSAAGWIFGSVLLWVIDREKVEDDQVARFSGKLTAVVLRLMAYTLWGIVIFGVIRALAYKKYEWNPAAGDYQVTLLVVKHILLTGILVWGLYYFVKARKRIKEGRHAKTE